MKAGSGRERKETWIKGRHVDGRREARRKQVESGWREQLREGKSGDGGGKRALLILRRLRSTCSRWPSPWQLAWLPLSQLYRPTLHYFLPPFFPNILSSLFLIIWCIFFFTPLLCLSLILSSFHVFKLFFWDFWPSVPTRESTQVSVCVCVCVHFHVFMVSKLEGADLVAAPKPTKHSGIYIYIFFLPLMAASWTCMWKTQMLISFQPKVSVWYISLSSLTSVATG